MNSILWTDDKLITEWKPENSSPHKVRWEFLLSKTNAVLYNCDKSFFRNYIEKVFKRL